MQPIMWVFSDLHVRNHDRIWVNRHNLCGDTAFALQQAAERVSEIPCIPVVLAGDNFEAKLQRADSIAMMRQFVATMREHNARVHFVDGQHDLSTPPLMEAISDWPIHLHKRTVDMGGLKVYGLDYQPVDTAAIELKAVPAGTDILITHQVWKDLMGEKYGIASLRDVAHARMVISGDYHHEKFMTVDREDGSTLGFLSPGPICTQDISEVAEHCGFVVYDNLEIRRFPLKSRKYTEVTVLTEEHVDAIVATDPETFYDRSLPDALQMGILRVKYPQNKPELFARICRVFGEHTHIFEKALTVTTAAGSDDEEARRTIALSDAPLETIIAEQYNDCPVAAQIAIRVAKATNKDEECQRIYDELMQGPVNGQNHA